VAAAPPEAAVVAVAAADGRQPCGTTALEVVMRGTTTTSAFIVLLSLLCAGILGLPTPAITADEETRVQSVDDRGLPLSVRQYLVEHYFAGTDPMDESVDSAVEGLRLPGAILNHIRAVEWESKQLERFASDKLYLLVACPDGSQRAIHFRDGEMRNDRELDDSRVRVLKRLYSDASFTASPAEELQAWLVKDSVDADAVFIAALACVLDQDRLALDGDTVRRARENLTAPDTNADALARALGALAESPYASENCWAAIWLISRMDKMSFVREQRQYSIPDLESIDARSFYENVFYAVKARNEFPWAADVGDAEFLQFVLSPRGTGEPLQRWRRHFYDALAPEVQGLARDEIGLAIAVANNAYGDYFQYEGDTTWEDFGLLTSLAVHEGRCEDMSNVQCALLHTLGIPACQAYTPWWGHCDGNHAWTWIRGVGDVPADGKNGVKVYVKTWDANEDVTSEYTPVTEIAVETASESEERAELMVWNHDEWRAVARTDIKDGQVTFDNVGCRLNFALLVRIPGDDDRLADVRTDGSVRWLCLETRDAPDEGNAFAVAYEQSSPLGEFQPDKEYTLEYCTMEGWKECSAVRTSAGGLAFTARSDRLYRVAGEGVSNRPFTVELDSNSGEVVTLLR